MGSPLLRERSCYLGPSTWDRCPARAIAVACFDSQLLQSHDSALNPGLGPGVRQTVKAGVARLLAQTGFIRLRIRYSEIMELTASIPPRQPIQCQSYNLPVRTLQTCRLGGPPKATYEQDRP